MSAKHNYISVERGPDSGIWCQDDAGYDVLAEQLPMIPQPSGSDRAAWAGYSGLILRVATPEKWVELVAAVEAARAQSVTGGRP